MKSFKKGKRFSNDESLVSEVKSRLNSTVEVYITASYDERSISRMQKHNVEEDE